MATFAKGKCSLCGGEITLGQRKVSGSYEVSCQQCHHVFYLGNDLTKAVNKLVDVDSQAHRKPSGFSKPPPGMMPSKKSTSNKWKLTASPVKILQRKCPKCGGRVNMDPPTFTDWHLYCTNCSYQFYKGPLYDTGIEIYDKATCGGQNHAHPVKKYGLHKPKDTTITNTTEKKAPVRKLTQKEAYEANKKSDICVMCGAPLSFHPAVSVKYCKCIESLS